MIQISPEMMGKVRLYNYLIPGRDSWQAFLALAHHVCIPLQRINETVRGKRRLTPAYPLAFRPIIRRTPAILHEPASPA